MVGLDYGNDTTAALTAAVEVFVWGELHPSNMAVSTPERVAFPQDVKLRRVSCGHEHYAAVDMAGVLYTWGLGSLGKLGHDSEQDELGEQDEMASRAVAALAG